MSRPLLKRSFVAGVLSLLAVSAQAKDEWTQFRGPDGTGHSKASGIAKTWGENQNVKWKSAIPGKGHSSPVISDNQIWLTTAVEIPLTAEAKAAKLAKIPNSKGLELAGSLSLRAVCIDRETGGILHNIELLMVNEAQPIHSLNSYASPTPVFENGKLFCHFGTYGTVAIDTVTGKVLWKNEEHHIEHQNGPGASPVVAGDVLIINYDGTDKQYVAAIDKASGKTAWTTQRSGKLDDRPDLKKAYCTSVVVEDPNTGLQVISPGANWVYGYDPKTGKELWRASYGQLGFSTVPRPIIGHGMVFVATSFMKSRLLAVKLGGQGDVSETHVAWKSDRQVPQKPSLLLVGDELYFVSDGGVATCLNAKTGDEHWSQRMPGSYSASPLFVDGRIHFFSQDGKTTVIAPGKEYKELAVNQLSDGFMASPAVAGKALFLRTETHLYRVEE